MIINDINIVSYLQQLTGEQVQLSRLDMSELSGLALHLRKGYMLYHGQLMGRDLVFACLSTDVTLSPKQAQKHIAAIAGQVHQPVILVLDNVPSYQRARYIEQRISFLIPGQQFFAPVLLMDLQSQNKRNIKPRTQFRPATQCMIIYHLMVQSIDGLSQLQIAERLGYSGMTISRAILECKEKELISTIAGVTKFKYNRSELWDQCKVYMQSPVRKVRYTDDSDITAGYLISGIQALSHYTDIAGDASSSVALTQDQYKELSSQYGDKINDNHGTHVMEIWDYAPNMLTNRNYVDPLSLYMSLHDDTIDERTSMALDNLIKDLDD